MTNLINCGKRNHFKGELRCPLSCDGQCPNEEDAEQYADDVAAILNLKKNPTSTQKSDLPKQNPVFDYQALENTELAVLSDLDYYKSILGLKDVAIHIHFSNDSLTNLSSMQYDTESQIAYITIASQHSEAVNNYIQLDVIDWWCQEVELAYQLVRTLNIRPSDAKRLGYALVYARYNISPKTLREDNVQIVSNEYAKGKE